METISILGGRAKHKGIYDLGAYYDFLYDTFRGRGYEVEEINYRQKVGPDGEPVELELFWTCYRVIDDYARFNMWCKTLIVGIKKEQVVINGQPTTKDFADVELELKGKIELDWKNLWSSNPILKFFRDIYDVHIYREVFNNLKKKLTEDYYFVEGEVKAFFNMQRFM